MNKKLNLQEKLGKLNFNRIAIADDLLENLVAAKEFTSNLNEIQFEFYDNGQDLISQILGNYKNLDLILTDRNMETKDSGLDVIETAWNYLVPAYIVSGGYSHANKEKVMITPDSFGISDGLTKDKAFFWEYTIDKLCDLALNNNRSLISTLVMVKRIGIEKLSDDFLGTTVRSIAKTDLDILEKK
ncbi:MAG: hypothetical protein KC589_11190 [Nanoarchaeota archaeon]|nr:hypothetical protein [Nanoarchaeota archaeon]